MHRTVNANYYQEHFWPNDLRDNLATIHTRETREILNIWHKRIPVYHRGFPWLSDISLEPEM